MATARNNDKQDDGQAEPVRLGDVVRRSREELGLSVRQIALRVGVHHATLSRMEAGEQRPTPETLQKLALVLELDEADLFALAGYRLPERLPAFPAYLRAKYRMPDEAAQQLNEYFGYLADKYDIDTDSDASNNSPRRVTKSNDN
jgi:transcriptional regulator with XRE-family HTH domain